MANRKKTDVERKEVLLRKMVEDRTGKACESWLEPQVHLTASNWSIVDKVHDEIMRQPDLVIPTVGSTGQMKNEVSPLLPYYDKMSRTLMALFEGLGLNYNVTPKKVTEPTKQGASEQGRIVELLRDIAGND